MLGLTVVSSAIDAGVQKKIHGSGTTTLVISNEEMNDIMKIVQALEDSGILLKGVIKIMKNETKKLSGKGSVRAGEGFSRAGEGIKKKLSFQVILYHIL